MMLTEQELMEKGLLNKNAISGRFYYWLSNQLALEEAGKKSKEWMTFVQAKLFGYKVKKWAKSVVIKYEANKNIIKTDPNGEIVEKNTHYIKFHRVFNLDDLIKVSNLSDDGTSSQLVEATTDSTPQAK